MLKYVYEGKSMIIKGPYSIAFKEGAFDVLGINPEKDERIAIPQNKRVAVNILKSGKVDVREDYPKSVTEVNSGTIPVSWEKLADKIIKNNINSLLIIGACNSGKTTLTTYIANKLLQNNKSVSLIDSDLGQSDIGPVGTIGMTVMEKKTVDLSECKVYKMHFVGAFSPSLHIVETLIGLKKLTAAAMMNSDTLIVDTSGLIDGDCGRLLKQGKIDMLNPDLVVLLQKENECEHLVKNLHGHRIFRAGLSNYTEIRTADARRLNRKNNILKYFANSQSVKLSLKKIKLNRCFLTSGIPIKPPENLSHLIAYMEKLSPQEGSLIVLKKQVEPEKIKELKKQFGALKIMVAGQESNIYVGLANENNECIGVGIIEKIDFIRDNIYILTNVDAQLIKTVSIGSIRLTSDGEELGYIEPGLI